MYKKINIFLLLFIAITLLLSGCVNERNPELSLTNIYTSPEYTNEKTQYLDEIKNSISSSDFETASQLADKLLSYTDLTSTETEFAYTVKSWTSAKQDNLEEAKNYANLANLASNTLNDHLLINAILALKDNNPQQAKDYLLQIKDENNNTLEDEAFTYTSNLGLPYKTGDLHLLLAQTYLELGDKDNANLQLNLAKLKEVSNQDLLNSLEEVVNYFL